MSEDQAAGNQPRFSILRVYLKDASFESPASPALFVSGDNWRPKVNVELVTGAVALGGDRYEVIVKATLQADDEAGKTSYIVEVQQAGLFEVVGVNQEQLGIALEVNCPTILFPYLREAIDNLLVHGSFPPAGLVPINFEARYAAELNRRKQAAEANPAIN